MKSYDASWLYHLVKERSGDVLQGLVPIVDYKEARELKSRASRELSGLRLVGGGPSDALHRYTPSPPRGPGIDTMKNVYINLWKFN